MRFVGKKYLAVFFCWIFFCTLTSSFFNCCTNKSSISVVASCHTSKKSAQNFVSSCCHNLKSCLKNSTLEPNPAIIDSIEIKDYTIDAKFSFNFQIYIVGFVKKQTYSLVFFKQKIPLYTLNSAFLI